MKVIIPIPAAVTSGSVTFVYDSGGPWRNRRERRAADAKGRRRRGRRVGK